MTKLSYMAFRTALFLTLTIGLMQSAAAQDKEKRVPTDEEIKLLVTQIDRAMSQYEALVNQEKLLLGDDADVGVDEKLILVWKAASKATTKEPQRFNSIVGYDIVTMLDDASRNAALVPGVAYTKVIGAIGEKNVATRTTLLMSLAQNANTTGTLLFTVSESASAMYLRFLEWQVPAEGCQHGVNENQAPTEISVSELL